MDLAGMPVRANSLLIGLGPIVHDGTIDVRTELYLSMDAVRAYRYTLAGDDDRWATVGAPEEIEPEGFVSATVTSTGVGTPYPADRSLLGDASARPLLPVQALHSAGEALFALSLVGSLFFNVSVDAARPRILLYLTLTMAPFAVLAPLIGPVIDKLRGGHRAVLLLSLGARAAVALLLASQLKTLLLYPEAFVIVVAAKVYVVARNTLVPSLVEDHDHLVVVNSRLARVGAVSGVVAALIGVALLQIADASWVLRLGAVFYALGALSALRIPAAPSRDRPLADDRNDGNAWPRHSIRHDGHGRPSDGDRVRPLPRRVRSEDFGATGLDRRRRSRRRRCRWIRRDVRCPVAPSTLE